MQKWKEFTDSVATIHHHMITQNNPLSFGRSCMVSLCKIDDHLYLRVVRSPDIDPYHNDANLPDFFKFLQKEWGVV